MNTRNEVTTILSWQRHSLAWQSAPHAMATAACDGTFSNLPELPDEQMTLQKIYLPMESLLSRAVHFPFQSPAVIDAELLFQELHDATEVASDAWWLAWHIERSHDGVAGMVFGLPEPLRQAMQSENSWGQARNIVVDGYERLQANLTGEQDCAVLDQDAEGLFFGFFDGQTWRGMSRMNSESFQSSDLLQLSHALRAMGFDPNLHAVIGHADSQIWEILTAMQFNIQGETVADLPSRHQANLALSSHSQTSLNFRHGRWSAQHAWERWSLWRRSAALLGLLFLTWLAGTSIQLSHLEHELTASQQRIESAFHQGLPHETVMLDALAQLRQAAGGGNSVQSHQFLTDLTVLGNIYKKQPWQLDSLSLRDGAMEMAGSVKDIASLNAIQSALQQGINREVTIVDTNMAGQHVAFRIKW